jgi:hypothetical protein
LRQSSGLLCSLLLVAQASIGAADYWAAKPFLTWTDKEVAKMDTDSPWAGLVSVPLPPSTPMPTGDAAGGRGSGGGEDRGFGPPVRRIGVAISWRSALPVKQAQVRLQVGQGGAPSPEQQAFLAKQENLYVLALRGLPPQFARSGPGVTVQALLKRRGKPDILPQEAAVQNTGTGPVMLLGFSRSDAITADDGEVEFVVSFGDFEVKKKFKLKDMVFAGALAL